MIDLCTRERQNADLKETLDAVSSSQENLKDKKIIDLAKKNRNLQMQVESAKTKAAKAAEIAIHLKNDKDSSSKVSDTPEKTKTSFKPLGSPNKSLPPIGEPSQKSVKDLEKKVTKLRNEN